MEQGIAGTVEPGECEEAAGRQGSIGAVHGTVLYIGAVLGTGVLLLPGLAVKAAGPASVVAWAVLIGLSAPLAYSFASLSGRYPDAGGVSSFARRAFGERAAICTGWTFYGGVLMGVPSAAAIGGQYVADALGKGHLAATLSAAAMLMLVLAANYAGLRVSGGLQITLTAAMTLLLVAVLVVAAPASRASNWHPFAPHGWLAVGRAASLLMFAFVGWEAVTPLSAEFRRPAHGIRIATTWALAVIAMLYLGIALVTVAVLGRHGGESVVPIADLMGAGLGHAGRVATGCAAVLLTLGAINAYAGGAGKLGSALARDGGLPRWMAKGSEIGGTPRRSLTSVAACTVAMMVLIGLDRATLAVTLAASSACFVAVYAYGCAAAHRLAQARSARAASALAGGLVVPLLIFSGPYLVAPAGLAAAALLIKGTQSRRSRRSR